METRCRSPSAAGKDNMRKKKNAFMTFIFSFIPGCAEMYWGFMKNGVSLLALFAITGFVSSIFGSGAFMIFALVIYAYAFFHARNMAHMSDEEFAEAEDEYLITEESLKKLGFSGQKYHRILAAALIVCGCWIILDSGTEYLGQILPGIRNSLWGIHDVIPRVFASVILIWIGVRMIRGKKEQDAEE